MANALGYVSETKTGFEGALAMMNLSAAIGIEKNCAACGSASPAASDGSGAQPPPWPVHRPLYGGLLVY